MADLRLRDAGGGWRCSQDGRCCTSPTGSRHHAHRVVGELLVCSTGEHETVRMDGWPMNAALAAEKTPMAPGAHSRSRIDDSNAIVSGLLAQLRDMAAHVAVPVPSATITTPRRLHAGAAIGRVLGDREQRDAVREIAAKVATIAQAARLQSWGQQLSELAAQITGDAARDDVAVLRRLSTRFLEVGKRLNAK